MAKIGCTWKNLGIAFIALFVLIGIASLFQKEEKPAVEKTPIVEEIKPISQNFTLAVKGDVWVIDEDNIPLVDTPQSFSDQDQFKAHLKCIIKSGQKVEIVKSKVIGNWKYVRVLSGLSCSGWVQGYIVNKASRVSGY